MQILRLKSVFSASAVYLSAEALTKLAQTFVVLGFAATSTKAEYASFVLVLAMHLLAAAIISGGAVEALTAARARNPSLAARWLMRPTLKVTGGIAVAVFIVGMSWAALSLFGLAGETTVATVVGATLSAIGIGIVRNASTVIQLDGRHRAAAIVRSAQLFVGYLLGALCVVSYRGDPVGAFFCGYAVGICIVGLYLAKSEGTNAHGSAQKLETRALLHDTFVFLPIALFGWLFGYGFSWMIEFTNRPRDTIAEFTVALSATFFCPMILTAVYSTWSPQYASATRTQAAAKATWDQLNRAVWQLPIIALGAIGAFALVAWDQLMLALGHRLVDYRFLEGQLAMIFIGYIFLSLHYVSTTVFVANQANALFFRISLLGNVLGIIIAALFLYASSLNIAIGYCVALSARGAMLALVAWYFWRISLPLFEIFVSTAAVGAGLLAVHVRSTPVTLAVVVVIATLLIWYGLRFRAQVRRLNLGGL